MNTNSLSATICASAFIFLSACSGEKPQPAAKEKPGKSVSTLVEGPDRLMREPGTDTPFTGVLSVPFADSPKRIEKEIPYRNGKKHGTERTLLSNGQVKAELVWEDGIGKTLRHFYKDGTLKAEMDTRADGNMQGRHRRYHPNGKLMNENTIAASGLPEGREKNYDDTGTLRSEYTWENGKIVQVHFETPLARTEREKWEAEAPAEDAN